MFFENLLFLFKYSANIPEIVCFWYGEKLKIQTYQKL